MFTIIDNVIITHSPPWYRTASSQTVALGIVFFWVFSAYTTIQFYARSTYGSSLASSSISAVYLTFTLTSLISSCIINKYGCRLCLFIGVLGYASLVLTSLIYFIYGGEDVIWSKRLVVLGGATLGIGASLLWTAQGRLILQYSEREEELNGTTTNRTNETQTKTGKLMGIFWAIFQCSSLVGGAVSFTYYNKQPKGSTLLYVLFLAFIIIGALCTQLLLPPTMLQVNTDVEMISNEQTPLTSNKMITREDNTITMKEDLSNLSWKEEAHGTMQMVLSKRVLLLSPLFFYTGYAQPYQQGTFSRFFTKRSIGVELIIFHLMEIIGALMTGRFLDSVGKVASDSSRRKRAILCLVAFVLINSTGNALAFKEEHAAQYSINGTAHDISNISVISPSLAFACWGFADAQIQVYCYWLMSGIYTSGSDHSRIVGLYKCIQSLGTAIGFYLIPASRLSEMSQLMFSSLVFVVGAVLSFSQLPTFVNIDQLLSDPIMVSKHC